MSDFLAAVTAACIVSTMGVVAVVRAWRPPTGRRRAGTPVPVLIETLEKTLALCAAERRITVHARIRVTRELLCLACRNFSPDRPLPDHVREQAS